ncbi:nitrilase-related carbon-nitrogen hydrolase, partial [Pseudomonas sp.]|uniref:nitrilase-related carbon-nitrogen hydrolase n=1 Tax=Pseudomonas sp. TaxID=306 RepID=UPI00286CAB20
MTPLIIAAAQSISIAGDLAANIVWHQRFMQVAAEQGVQLLVFPELSLTGYERGLAAELAFAPGTGGSTLTIGADTVALAVCADFSHASHAAAAAQQDADLYAAGVLITENGYAPDTALLQGYASAHSMTVLMANHGGATGGWESAGRSAIWASVGSLV